MIGLDIEDSDDKLTVIFRINFLFVLIFKVLLKICCYNVREDWFCSSYSQLFSFYLLDKKINNKWGSYGMYVLVRRKIHKCVMIEHCIF